MFQAWEAMLSEVEDRFYQMFERHDPEYEEISDSDDDVMEERHAS